MTKIDIFSGFLGAGKTTLIKKLLAEALNGQKTVLIENEFGEIGIDGGFLKEAGIEITEMNSGCICCSLVGDFGEALKKVLEQYHPERIIIEPSGVGKLSDVIKAVQEVANGTDVIINSAVTVVDANKCRMYMKNFGEFFNNQVEYADTIVLSRTQLMKEEKLDTVLELIHEKNEKAKVITTPWEEIDGTVILKTMEQRDSLEESLLKEHHHHDGHECCGGHHHDHEEEHECCGGHHHDHEEEHECCGGHHHDHEEEHECCGGHHHDHEEEHECCGGHHHDHEEEHECCGGHHHDHEEEHECCGGHHHDHEEEHECCGGHHHDHGEECGCGGEHHHHHHADEVFTSWGKETPHKYTKDKMNVILEKLANTQEYGIILRAKGMVPSEDGEWIYFDLVPGEYELRAGEADYTGRLCVIGTNLKEESLMNLFELQ